MDISVLTEQRREMVINLLKGMKIRKSDGEGFDKDDVYACMQQLCDVYEKSIDDLTVSYETEINELQDKYQKYDENNDLYISLIMEAKKSSNEIINKAKSEVDEILAAGKEQIAAQEDEIERFRLDVAQEKADLEADLEAARTAAAREKEELAAGIEDEKKRTEVVREQYRDQIAVMDREFGEIKTNILRTAGKIDGLRAQLEDAGEETQWQLQDEPKVEEPAEEAAAEAPEEMTFEQLVSKLQQEDAAKAGPAEVEAPAETPMIEPEIEIPAAEIPVEEVPVEEGFHFEPVFDAPAETPAVEAPFEMPVEAPVEAPAEAEGPFAEPALDIPEVDAPVEAHAQEIPADIPVDISFDEPKEQSIDDLIAELPADVPADIPAAAPAEPEVPEFNLDALTEEVKEEVKPEVAEGGLGSIEDLALEEISLDPLETPAAAEEAVEEISFEGLEELFKE